MENQIKRYKGVYPFPMTSFLSNYYETEVTIPGRTFKSSEAAYHSFKTDDEDMKDAFTKMSADESKHAAKPGKMKYVPGWDAIKLDVMYKVVKAKFSQNRLIARELISMKDIELIEDTTDWNDTYWGCVWDSQKNCYVGDNHLGHILMTVRDELFSEVNDE